MSGTPEESLTRKILETKIIVVDLIENGSIGNKHSMAGEDK